MDYILSGSNQITATPLAELRVYKMPFVTLEQYKTYADITSNDKDRKLEGLITRVEQFIKGYCGINFTYGSVTEDLDIEGNYVFLSQFPVGSITSVQYYNFEGTLTTIETTDYRLYEAEGMLELTDAIMYEISTSKYKNKQVRVVYLAGYTTIPEEVKLATMDLVKYYDKSEYTPVASANIRTIDYDVMHSVSLPPHIRRVLSLYRKVE